MVYFIKCLAEVHYYEVSLFTIFKIVKNFLCKIYQLSFTAMFGVKTMLKRTKKSKWVIIFETRMCSISIEAIQVSGRVYNYLAYIWDLFVYIGLPVQFSNHQVQYL